jgi:hypothetical protein
MHYAYPPTFRPRNLNPHRQGLVRVTPSGACPAHQRLMNIALTFKTDDGEESPSKAN